MSLSGDGVPDFARLHVRLLRHKAADRVAGAGAAKLRHEET